LIFVQYKSIENYDLVGVLKSSTFKNNAPGRSGHSVIPAAGLSFSKLRLVYFALMEPISYNQIITMTRHKAPCRCKKVEISYQSLFTFMPLYISPNLISLTSVKLTEHIVKHMGRKQITEITSCKNLDDLGNNVQYICLQGCGV
jgi:hypothetical protein